MTLLDENAFAGLLKKEISDNIFLIFGDDDYLKEFYCNKLIDKTVDDAFKTFNLHIYNDDDTSLDDIFADAETLPMMSEHTCLLVRNFPLHKAGSEQIKAFEAGLKDIPETTVMIFYYNTLDVTYNKNNNAKWFSLIDMFMKHGKAVQLNHRTPLKIAQMLINGAPKRGTTISKETALYLIQAVGDDIQNLLNEFNKVCSFADGREITEEMIDTVCVKTTEAQVFGISTAILNLNTDKAFSVANELLNRKTAIQAIIGALASTYTNLYRFKVAKNEQKGIQDLADMFQYKNTFVLKEIPSLSPKISLKGVRYSIQVLLDADILTKSRTYDSYTLMSEIIAKLGTATKM